MSELNNMPGRLLQADVDDLHRRGDRAWKRLERRWRAYQRRLAFRSFVKRLFVGS